MGIYAFWGSVLFLFLVARIRRIRLLSTYGIFILFQILYNLVPWVTLEYGPKQTLFALLGDGRLIYLQLWLVTGANLCFGTVFLLFYRGVRLQSIDKKRMRARRRNYFWLAFPFFILTCGLCAKYGWHAYTFSQYADSGDAPGGMFTVTAYAKYFFVAIYLYYIAKYGLDKWSWRLFAEHVIVMGIDGGRTTFLPIMLVTMMVFIDNSQNKKKIRRIYIGAMAGILLSIGARALIVSGDGVAQKMLIPVAIEGTMGDYPALQSLEGVTDILHPPYTFGISYVYDPLVWLLPQGMRGDSASFAKWEKDISYALEDGFAPMGGFYYISEAVAAFSYAGPAIITTIFALSLVWFERAKNRHKMLYVGWVSTFGLLFVKMIFANCFKLFLINMIFLGMIEGVARARSAYANLPRRLSFDEATETVAELV